MSTAEWRRFADVGGLDQFRRFGSIITQPAPGPPKTATLSAVRAAMLAAGFLECPHGAASLDGFEIGAGVVGGRYEVIVGARFARQEWSSLETMWSQERAVLDDYLRHVRSAGFGAVIDQRRVIVTPAEEER